MPANEINKAYRSADGDNYSNNVLVIGKEIRPSATTKKREVPELERRLAGSYPTWFKWHGWCDNDLSFQIPILMSEEIMAKYQKLVARGEDTPEAIKELQKNERVDVLPDSFKVWVQEAITTEDEFRRAPYFIKENFHNLTELRVQVNFHIQ